MELYRVLAYVGDRDPRGGGAQILVEMLTTSETRLKVCGDAAESGRSLLNLHAPVVVIRLVIHLPLLGHGV